MTRHRHAISLATKKGLGTWCGPKRIIYSELRELQPATRATKFGSWLVMRESVQAAKEQLAVSGPANSPPLAGGEYMPSTDGPCPAESAWRARRVGEPFA